MLKYMGNNMKKQIVFEPGLYLEEVLREIGMTAEELAYSIDTPLPVVHDILSGDAVLTDDIASQLESAVGVRAETWMDLEQEYRCS